MYVYLVMYLSTRIVFKTCEEAEKFVELMYGDSEVANPVIMPCLMAGGSDE